MYMTLEVICAAIITSHLVLSASHRVTNTCVESIYRLTTQISLKKVQYWRSTSAQDDIESLIATFVLHYAIFTQIIHPNTLSYSPTLTVNNTPGL